MTQPTDKPEFQHTVRQDDFRRDPGAVMRQALDSGRVVITDASGTAVAVLSLPMDRRDVIGE